MNESPVNTTVRVSKMESYSWTLIRNYEGAGASDLFEITLTPGERKLIDAAEQAAHAANILIEEKVRAARAYQAPTQ